MRLLPSIACAILVAMPMVGCASADRDEGDTATTSETANTGQTTATNPEAATSSEPLNDGQILGVVKAANEGEVVAGQLAAQKAVTPEVRDFAQDMVHDHTTGKQAVAQTAAASTPASDSPMASSLAREVNSQLESLSAQSGRDFDRAYIEGQVKMHRDLLEALRTDLLPNAKSAEVRKLLEDTRTKVSEHLQEAQELRQQLASPAAG